MRLASAVAALCLTASYACAADLDCAQVKLIVPYPAGGATDVAARLVGERLEAALKKSVIIETRPGATGNIGTVAVINSKPDGCTLLVNAAVIATFPYSFNKLNYDPINDLVPVGGIGITPTLLIAAPSVAANDVNELVQLSKTRPDGVNFSTAGYGLLQHLAVEEIAQRTGAKFTHIVYKGGGQATTDLITARVDFGSFAAGTVNPFLQDGKLKALAVVQDQRSALVPKVATTAEQGLPGLDAGVHFMLFAPAGTPKEIVAMLNSELRAIVGNPAMKERFLKIGFDPSPITAEETADIVRRTGETWAPLIKRLNIKLD
ncbi:MAG: Bug family tripartite tricarboxylate transporter substrate binding protein [Xanthobacteraceae bacterium]|jgi:tripartite-type tricarboxylate transporter receptor subunit TctC